MLRRNDIGRHLTSEMVFSGDLLRGFSDTIEHPDGLGSVDTGLIDTTPAIEDYGEQWHPNPLPEELVSRRRLRRQHASPLRPLRRQPALPGRPDPRAAARARGRAHTGRLHGAGVGRLSGCDVRRARRRGGDPAGRQAPACAGTHCRTSDRRRGDGRRPGRPRRRRRPLVRGPRTWGNAGAVQGPSNWRRRPTSRMSRRSVSRTWWSERLLVRKPCRERSKHLSWNVHSGDDACRCSPNCAYAAAASMS